MRSVLFLIIIILLALVGSFFVSQQASYLLILSIVVPVVFFAAFINPGIGLYILIFSMLLSPEFEAGQTYGSSLGRGVTLRIEDFLLIIIGISWFFRKALDKESGLFLQTPLNKPIFYYILTCLLATGFGILDTRINPKTGMFFVLKYIEYFIVFFMVISHVQDEKQVKRFVFCLFLTCLIVSILGISQIPGGGRVSAPFEGEVGEPNTFGGYLVFVLAIALGLIYQLKDIRLKISLGVLIAVIIPPMLFTGSRASYLAFIPMIFVLAMMMKNRAIIIGVMLSLIIISPLFLPTVVKDRVMHTFNQPEEPGQFQVGDLHIDTSTSARLRSWAKAITDWPNHPILGYGVTGYSFVDAQFPRVLAETGIVGLLVFISLLVSIFKMAVANYRQVTTPFAKGICMGYIAGFIGLIFHALGANTFIIVRVMEPFWFFTGIVFVLPMVEMQKEDAVEKKAVLARASAYR